MLAPYATDPSKTKGRVFQENATPYRNEFQRDKDRIIHSNTFRRLQYKTQVFVNHEGDHYRNRLTHSIEVASIARSIARDLNASEDLAECIALGHDLGHSPFGHAGEDELSACMKNYGGFCHNAHAIKLLTKLEKRYCSYEGLNLTWEVIEGIAKHNGPITGDIPIAITEYDGEHSLNLHEYSSLEAQIAALSDDITYNCHDLEDGIRANMFDIQDLLSLSSLEKIVENIMSKYPRLEKGRQMFEIVRELAHVFIEDLLYTTKENIKNYNIKTDEDVRKLGKPLASFSSKVLKLIEEIRFFLKTRVYQNHRVILTRYKCKKVVRELFNLYFNNPECMPLEWRLRAEEGEYEKARAIADFIAGMTDRYAIEKYNALFSLGNTF
ncbi:MAG: deoxyguanosinetriphosphate triphosphohydrolase [Rickettsiaceae bacterium]|nr:deoxyguanosinetriphosphate triphosphohydrolase [Rickettsiaceae bacterium]